MMAPMDPEISDLVQSFARKLEAAVDRSVAKALVDKHDHARSAFLSASREVEDAPAETTRRLLSWAGSLSGEPLAPAGRNHAIRLKRHGPRPGFKVKPKPCPFVIRLHGGLGSLVCGVLSTAKRCSYLCEAHRTPENMRAYRGKR